MHFTKNSQIKNLRPTTYDLRLIQRIIAAALLLTFSTTSITWSAPIVENTTARPMPLKKVPAMRAELRHELGIDGNPSQVISSSSVPAVGSQDHSAPLSNGFLSNVLRSIRVIAMYLFRILTFHPIEVIISASGENKNSIFVYLPASVKTKSDARLPGFLGSLKLFAHQLRENRLSWIDSLDALHRISRSYETLPEAIKTFIESPDIQFSPEMERLELIADEDGFGVVYDEHYRRLRVPVRMGKLRKMIIENGTVGTLEDRKQLYEWADTFHVWHEVGHLAYANGIISLQKKDGSLNDSFLMFTDDIAADYIKNFYVEDSDFPESMAQILVRSHYDTLRFREAMKSRTLKSYQTGLSVVGLMAFQAGYARALIGQRGTSEQAREFDRRFIIPIEQAIAQFKLELKKLNEEISVQNQGGLTRTRILGGNYYQPDWWQENAAKIIRNLIFDKEKLAGYSKGRNGRSELRSEREIRNTIFQNINGLIAISTMKALIDRGVFGLFDNPRSPNTVSLEAIASNLVRTVNYERNVGNISGAMRTLALSGWIKIHGRDKKVSYELTEQGWVTVLILNGNSLSEFFRKIGFLKDLHARFRKSHLPQSKTSDRQHHLDHGIYAHLVDKAIRGWDLPKSNDQRFEAIPPYVVERTLRQIRTQLDGIIMSPTMVALGMPAFEEQGHKLVEVKKSILNEFVKSGSEKFVLDLAHLEGDYDLFYIQQALRLLEHFGLAKKDLTDPVRPLFYLTEAGVLFRTKVGSYGVTNAYLKSYEYLNEMLFGISDPLGIDQDLHIDRAMDIWASGFSHQPYIEALIEKVLPAFNLPIEEQPAGILDVGAGDGEVDKKVIEAILTRSRRAQYLKTHPLVVVAADYNSAARARISETLKGFADKKEVVLEIIPGDVTRPETYDDEIRQRMTKRNLNIGLRDLIQMQIFLPHERKIQLSSIDQAEAILRKHIKSADKDILKKLLKVEELPGDENKLFDLVSRQFTISYSNKGRLIPSVVQAADFILFVSRWVEYAPHGLVFLELHTPRSDELIEAVPEDPNKPMKIESVPAAAYWGTHWISQSIMPYEEYSLALTLAGFQINHSTVYPRQESGLPAMVSLTALSRSELRSAVTQSQKPLFKRMLVVERGEKAVRIVRAAKSMGIHTIAVFSDFSQNNEAVQEADESVKITSGNMADSFSNIEGILDAARELNADVIHPGFGALSENLEFLKRAAENSVSVIAPPRAALDKVRLYERNHYPKRQILRNIFDYVNRYDVPVIPNSGRVIESVEDGIREAHQIGFPVVIKSVIGGPDRLIELVESEEDFSRIFRDLLKTARYALREDGLYVEKYMKDVRHLEVQFAQDESGNIVVFPPRDNSLQRQYKKLAEEYPIPGFTPEQVSDLKDLTRKILQGLRRDGIFYNTIGTMEFLIAKDGKPYFLDITNNVHNYFTTALDGAIVKPAYSFDPIQIQIALAAGKTLEQLDLLQSPKSQDHMIELLIFAEDPDRNFEYPRELEIARIKKPPTMPGVRLDLLVKEGVKRAERQRFLLARLVVSGRDRAEVLERLKTVLKKFEIEGRGDGKPLVTTLSLYRTLVLTSIFKKGTYDTQYADSLLAELKKMSARKRIEQLIDPKTDFQELNADLEPVDFLQFVDTASYASRIQKSTEKTKEKDAIVTGIGQINGKKTAIAAMEFYFNGGTFGSVVGEKIARLFEYAGKEGLPVVLVSISGGARVQEGTTSLMQLPKGSVAIAKYLREGGLYISIMTEPTLAGPAVSFSNQGSILIAEPKTTIGFAGKRVTKSFLKVNDEDEALLLGPRFQRSDLWLEGGFIDDIVPRSRLRERVAGLVDDFYAKGDNQKLQSGWSKVQEVDLPLIPSAYEPVNQPRQPMAVVNLSRSIGNGSKQKRPTTRDYIQALGQSFEEWDNSADLTVLGGVVHLRDGRKIVVIGTQKGLGKTVRSEDYPNDYAGRRKFAWEAGRREMGMPLHNGYQFSRRLMKYAEDNQLPFLTVLDLPGGYSGPEGEDNGIAKELAVNLLEMANLTVPVVTVITGEGGSGGAMALALSNSVLMTENAYYSVIAPESAAEILFNKITETINLNQAILRRIARERQNTKEASRLGDLTKNEAQANTNLAKAKEEMGEAVKRMAAALQITPEDLKRRNIIEEIIPEPEGGAQSDPSVVIQRVNERILVYVDALSALTPDQVRSHRYQRFRGIGNFKENGHLVNSKPLASDGDTAIKKGSADSLLPTVSEQVPAAAGNSTIEQTDPRSELRISESRLRREKISSLEASEILDAEIVNQFKVILDAINLNQLKKSPQLQAVLWRAIAGDSAVPVDQKLALIIDWSAFFDRGLYAYIPAFLEIFGDRIKIAVIRGTEIDSLLAHQIDKKIIVVDNVDEAIRGLSKTVSIFKYVVSENLKPDLVRLKLQREISPDLIPYLRQLDVITMDDSLFSQLKSISRITNLLGEARLIYNRVLQSA